MWKAMCVNLSNPGPGWGNIWIGTSHNTQRTPCSTKVFQSSQVQWNHHANNCTLVNNNNMVQVLLFTKLPEGPLRYRSTRGGCLRQGKRKYLYPEENTLETYYLCPLHNIYHFLLQCFGSGSRSVSFRPVGSE